MGHYHYDKVQKLQNAQVTAVFDINEKKLEEARAMGLAAYTTISAFLKSDVELVVICTPNQFHAPYAMQALQSQKHVLTEKPVTMTVESLEQVLACARENERIFSVHQNRRWDADYLCVSDVVHKKTIGSVTTIESTVMGERGVCYGWRADPDSGGGMLYDWGVHLIDQMLQLFGKDNYVQSVYARLLSVLTPAVDDYFEVHMTFGDGVCAKISVGTFALQKKPRWFVFGDRGTLMLDDFSGEKGGMSRIRGEVEGFDSVIGKTDLGPSRTMAPLQREMLETLDLPRYSHEPLLFWENLVSSCQGKVAPFVTWSDMLRQMKVVEAAFLSSAENQVISCHI
jgi:predicted dehydrogenase